MFFDVLNLLVKEFPSCSSQFKDIGGQRVKNQCLKAIRPKKVENFQISNMTVPYR